MRLKTLLILIKFSLIKFFKEFRACLKREKFYCRSLQGKSQYSLSINSDLTVTCNCSDLWETNQIGDLKTQTLDEIFTSPLVMKFKKRLAGGRLAILDCALCSELRSSKDDIDIWAYKFPRRIIVENTINCHLNCLSCNRDRLRNLRSKNTLTIADIKLVSNILKHTGVKIISYFKQGEPFLSQTIKEEILILKENNPSAIVVSSTNGSAIDTKDKLEAALMLDHIFISLPGIDQGSISRYQRGADFDKSFRVMKEIIKLRGLKKKPVVEWKYVLFRWNDSEGMLLSAIKLAREAKVDVLSFWKTLSPLYGFSYRYYLGYKYFQNFGQHSWKGRKIDFRRLKAE
jgi:hypothetical protein